MTNPFGKSIAKGSGRRLVVSDIHGCLKTFQSLVERINLNQNDQLFLLGDYVNKGPKSRAVVDRIIKLSKFHSVYPLLGNHDLMVLSYLEGNTLQEEQIHQLGNKDFFGLNDSHKEKYLKFFSELHYYFTLDNFLLVHAGFDFNLENPFWGSESMLNIRWFHYDPEKAKGKTIIHGHFPHQLRQIREHISQKRKIIPLDNGCVYDDREGQGNLLCLELNSNKLFIQPKLD